MTFANLMEISAIVALIVWMIVLPIIYPRYIEQFIIDRILKKYLLIFASFFFTYLCAGILLMVFGYFISGMSVVVLLVVAIILMVVFDYDAYSVILDFVYDNEKNVLFYFFTAIVLFVGILLTNGIHWKAGIIAIFAVVLNVLSTWIGLKWKDKKFVQENKNLQAETLNIQNNESSTWDISNVFTLFNEKLMKDLEFHINETVYSIKEAFKSDYINYIPEEFQNIETDQLDMLANKYLLNEKNDVPAKDKKIIKLFLLNWKTLTQWQTKVNEWRDMALSDEPINIKKQEVSKKIVKKIVKQVKKDNKSPRIKESEKKPVHSISPDNN